MISQDVVSSSIDSLHSQSSCRVGAVSPGQACMHHTVDSLPLCRQPVSNMRAVALGTSDNTNMGCLGGGENSVAIYCNIVDSKFHLGLHAVVLGGEDEKLGLRTNQLHLELLAIELS